LALLPRLELPRKRQAEAIIGQQKRENNNKQRTAKIRATTGKGREGKGRGRVTKGDMLPSVTRYTALRRGPNAPCTTT